MILPHGLCDPLNRDFPRHLIISMLECIQEDSLLLLGQESMRKIHLPDEKRLELANFSKLPYHVIDRFPMDRANVPIFVSAVAGVQIKKKSVVLLYDILDIALLVEDNKEHEGVICPLDLLHELVSLRFFQVGKDGIKAAPVSIDIVEILLLFGIDDLDIHNSNMIIRKFCSECSLMAPLMLALESELIHEIIRRFCP